MTVVHYDPDKAPDPEEWLGLDEATRIELIEAYHVRARIEVPNVRVHALFHVIVENQIALGDELPVLRKLRSLMASGLDRHDAIHAIASVLTSHVHSVMAGSELGPGPNRAYFRALKRLTASRWQRSG
jgi:hypothetical protein